MGYQDFASAVRDGVGSWEGQGILVRKVGRDAELPPHGEKVAGHAGNRFNDTKFKVSPRQDTTVHQGLTMNFGELHLPPLLAAKFAHGTDQVTGDNVEVGAILANRFSQLRVKSIATLQGDNGLWADRFSRRHLHEASLGFGQFPRKGKTKYQLKSKIDKDD